MTPLEYCFWYGVLVAWKMSRDSRKTYERERKQRFRQMSRDKESINSISIDKKERKKERVSVSRDRSELYTPTFIRFWLAYPSTKDKLGAAQKFKAALANGADPEMLITSAEVYAAECKRDQIKPQFISHAKTWLNHERWNDYQPKENVVVKEEFLERRKKLEEKWAAEKRAKGIKV